MFGYRLLNGKRISFICYYLRYVHHIIYSLLSSSSLLSQAAEGEFAFVIAVFAKDQDLISADLYASIVLAVLISTIIPPFALRFTLSYYNKIAAKMIKQAEDLERQRATTIDASLGLTREEQEKRLRVSIICDLF